MRESHDQQSGKRSYESPKIEVEGRVEELTQWIGGAWGEFFNGQGSGWNPWAQPGGGGS